MPVTASEKSTAVPPSVASVGDHPARTLRELTAALLANPDDSAAFDSLTAFLLERRRGALLLRWLDWKAAHGARPGLAQAYAQLGAKLSGRPLEHELADRAFANAERLAQEPGQSDLPATFGGEVRRQREQLRALRPGLAGLVRELRAHAVDERDRRRAASLYLQIAELHAVYDDSPQFRLRVQENLQRCFLLWPAMPAALDTLERLAFTWRTLPAGLDALTQMAQATADGSAAAEVWMRVARLGLCHDGDHGPFAQALRNALLQDPGRLDAAFALAEVLLSEQRIAEASEVLRGSLTSLATGASSAAGSPRLLPLEVADLAIFAAGPLAATGQPEAVLSLLSMVLPSVQGDTARLTELQALAEDLGLRELLVHVIEARLTLRPARDVQASLRDLQAETLLGLSRPREAFGAWVGALRLRPDWSAVWGQLETLATELSADDELDATYAEIVEASGEGVRTLAGHLDSRLEARRVAGASTGGQAPADAEETAPPEGEDADAELARLIEESRFREAADLTGRLGEAAGLTLERAALRRRQADLLLRAGEPVEALGLLGELIAATPTDAETLVLLERAAKASPPDGATAGLLARAYLAAGDFARGLPMLEQEARAHGGDTLAAELWLQAARLYEDELVDRQSALRALGEGCRVDPTNAPLRAELARVARELKQQEQGARLLLDLAASVPAAVAPDLLRLALVLAEESGVRILHAEVQRRLLELHPDDSEALSKAAGRAMAAGDAQAAVTLLERRIQASTDKRERAGLLLQAGRLVLGSLANPVEAARLLRAALESGADPGEALGPLAEALLSADQRQEAVAVLEREVGHWTVRADPGRAARVGLHLAELLRQLGKSEAAVEAYRDVLLRRASEPAALQALEEMLAAGEADRAAGAALADVYEENRDLQRLAEILEILADAEGDLEARSRILRRAAALYQGDLHQPSQAFAALARAVRLSPSDQKLRTEVAELAKAQGLEADLADLWMELLERVPETQRPELWHELAALSERLGDLDQAAALLSRILAVGGQSPTSQARALRGLYRAELGRGGADAALGAADRLLDLTVDRGERVALLREVAKVAETQLGDGLRAIELWHQLLEEEADDAEAAAELERLSETYGVVTERAEALAARLRQAGGVGTAAGRTVALRLVEARRTQKNPGAALELLREVLLAAPGDEKVVAHLREWALSTRPGAAEAFQLLDGALAPAESGAGQTEGVAQSELLEGRLALATGEERELIWSRIAAMAQQRGSAADEIEVLERWAEEAGSPAPLVGLVRIHRSSDNVGGLASALWRLAHVPPRGEETDQRKDLLFEAGALRDEKLNDLEGAMAAYRDILAIDPNDPAALQKLSALLGRASRWEELVKVLSQRAEQALVENQRQEAAEVQLQLALVLQRHLHDFAGALSYYRAVLSEQPRHPGVMVGLEPVLAEATNPEDRAEAARLLEPLYAQARNLSGLVSAVQAQVEGKPAGPERGPILRRLAQLYLDQLKNPEMAFVSASQALREDPEDPQGVDLAFQVAKAAGLFEELAELLEGIAPMVRAAEPSRRIHWNLATLYQGPLQNPSKAIAEWRIVVELAPEDRSAFEQLSALYVSSGDVASLLEVLRRQLAVAEDLEARRFLLHRVGEIQDQQQHDAPAAFATYRRLLELDPGDAEAVARLGKLAEALQRWPELAALLEQQVSTAAAAGQNEDQVAALFRLASLYQGPLRNAEGAEGLYARILELSPGHAPTLERLEAVLAANPQNGRIAELLERAHRGGQNWGKVAAALDARASAMADPQARRDIWLELAKLQEENLARPDLAFIALTRAFRDDPADATVRASLERVSRLSESHEELAGLYEEALEDTDDPALTAGLSLQLGLLYDGPLQDPGRALPFLERARDLAAPGVRAALPALERLYGAAERWDRLAEIIDEEVGLAEDGQEKVSLLFRVAQIAEERLSNSDRAVEALEAILALDPNHLPALRALQRLYEQGGKGQELFDVLKREVELTPAGASRDRLTARLAEVATAKLGDHTAAIDLWNELLARNPRAENALVGLETALEHMGRWEELAEHLGRRLKTTTDPREASRLNDKLGLILGQHLGRADEAMQSFRAVLERDPKNRRALLALRDLHQARGEREEVAAILRRLIPLQENAAGVKEVRLQLAQVLGELGRREEAIEAARRALDLEPHAYDELKLAEAIFRSLNAYPELARSMEARAALAGPDQREEAIALLFEVARVHAEQLRKPEAGASALERVLEMDPASEKATTELKRIYTKTGDWRRYSSLLDRLANGSEDLTVRAAVLKELALVQEQKLGEKELAFLALCRALQATPLDESIGESALRVARDSGALDELSEVYENVVDALGTRPEVEGILLRLASLQDQDLDRPKPAEESLRRLLALQPGNQKALDALAALFVRRGRSREYVVTMEQKVESLATVEEKKVVLAELAKAYDELLGEPADAILTLRRALDLDPSDPVVLQHLVAILKRERAWPDLVALLQRAREMVSEPLERGRIQLQIAEITELSLGDDEGALSAYHLALELDPQAWHALEALERLYTKLDRGAELLRVYDRQIDLVEPADRVKILFKAAQIWEQKLGNGVNAIACLEGVQQLDEGNPIALRELTRLYREEHDWERLAVTYQRHLEIAQEPQEIVALHVALGDLLYRELGRADQAEVLFARALEMDPTSQPALRGLGQLYEGSGNWAQSLEMIRREVRLAASSEQAVQLYTRAGRIYEEMLGDMAEAEGAYRRALEIEPGYLPALRALKKLSFERQAWDSYLEAAKQEAQVAPESPEKAQLFQEIGRFYQDVREDPENAERNYVEALRRVPNLLEAARPLSDLYVSRSAWEPAERMLDIVVVGMRDEEARELCRQYYRLGYVAEKLEHMEKALEAYRRAYELDATYLPALEGLGSLLVRARQFDEALKIYQAILIHHRDELTDLEVVEIYWQLGEIHRALAQLDRAQKSFEKALEIDASHEPSHQALAELLEGVGNYELALEHRQKLLETLEGDARFEASVQLARLARERLADPYQAIDAYTQAMKVRPDSLAVMEALLALYRETKQGQKAVEILERMLDQPLVQDDPRRQRDLHLALAEVYRDEVRDDEAAIAHFNQALDLDPANVQAFAAIEGLLTDRQMWPQLEESYHAMIKRLAKIPEAHQARLALWKALGELYQKVLKNPEGAILAYEVLAKAEPDNGTVIELLADLYSVTPGKEQQAIEVQRRSLLTTSDPVKVVKTLVRLHAALKEYDKAYVAAQVLVHLLGERSPDEEQIIVRLKRYARESAQKQLSERHWSEALTHERLKSPLAELLGICQAATAGAFAVDHARLNITRKRDKVDVASSMLFFVNMFKYVAKTMAMETLELFKVPGQGGLILGNTFPPCLIAGEDMFKDRPKRELYFVIAKAMAFSRPELAMARLHPIEDLEAIVQAAVSLVVPTHPITADPEAVDRARRKLEKSLSESARQPLSRVVREALRDPTQLDLRSYLEGVEHTANRAGILLCTEVEVAMRCFSQDQGAAARLPLRSKVRDLMIFCLSEPYFKLRQSLGLSVEVKVEGRATT